MNHELLSLVRETGYLSDADLSPQARYDLLTPRFWKAASALGYNVSTLRRKLWVASGLGLPDYIEQETNDALQEHGDSPIESLLDGQSAIDAILGGVDLAPSSL